MNHNFITIKEVIGKIFPDVKIEISNKDTLTVDDFIYVELSVRPKKIRTISGTRDLIIDMYTLSICHNGTEVDLGDYDNLTSIIQAIASQIVKDKVNCLMSFVV